MHVHPSSSLLPALTCHRAVLFRKHHVTCSTRWHSCSCCYETSGEAAAHTRILPGTQAQVPHTSAQVKLPGGLPGVQQAFRTLPRHQASTEWRIATALWSCAPPLAGSNLLASQHGEPECQSIHTVSFWAVVWAGREGTAK